MNDESTSSKTLRFHFIASEFARVDHWSSWSLPWQRHIDYYHYFTAEPS